MTDPRPDDAQPLALSFTRAISAGIDTVWELISTAAGRAAWFGTDAAIDLRVGGESRVSWDGEQPIDGVVAVVERPRRLRIAYELEGEELGAEEYLLDHDGGITTVRLIQSMPPDDGWADWYGDLERGWRLFLASLDFAASGAATPGRVADCRFIPAPGGRAATWPAVRSVLGLDADPTAGTTVATKPLPGATVALVDAPHSLLLTTPTRTLLVDLEGDGDHLQLYAQTASHTPEDTEAEARWRRGTLQGLADAVG